MKKITLMKNMAAAAVFALAVSAAVSCDPEEKKDDTVYSIELVNPLDSDIFINSDAEEDVTVALNLTNLTREQLTIDQGGQDWCFASVSKDKDEIVLKHGDNTSEDNLEAVFTVSANVKGTITPLTFKVTKRGTEVEIYVEISSPDITPDEYGGNVFTTSSAERTLTITVKTNASTWYLSDNNMVYDDEYNPIEWYTVDKTSGRNGETCTIKFSENKSTSDRMSQFVFAEEPDAFMGTSVMVTQYGPAATYAKAIIDYDYDNPVSDSHNVAFAAEDTGTSGAFDFDLEKDGSIELKWMKPGTMEEDATATDWISISSMYGYSIVPTKNTGAERKVDLVIVPAGGSTELFRFKITQAGK